MIDDALQEASNYVSLGDQILSHVGKVIFDMGLDTMASTSVLLPKYLTMDGMFHEFVLKHVDTGTTFI